jgi:small-conductance mechanosensitive channel
MNEIINQITSLWSSFVVIIIIALAIIINKWLFNRLKREKGTIVPQVIAVVIVLIGLLAFTITLPIEHSLKGQIISLIGIVLSAALALSSTTIIGNALAGLMNSSIKNFKLGDFVRIENNFGRVTKKGLFRTEIQTEDRNLTSLPNLYIASHPVKILRDSGTIISTTVSLGYDLNRSNIEKLLLTAAKESGLTEQFVYIDNLGDFSVTYKIYGLLTDINKYFTANSLLNAKVMDNLHRDGIEIVSPSFMNQRQVNEAKFIPKVNKSEKSDIIEKFPEEIVFDKAIEADKIDEESQSLKEIENQITKLKQSLKDSGDKDKINERINNLKKLKENLNKSIEDQKDKLDKHK